jgi:hypothetical protein
MTVTTKGGDGPRPGPLMAARGIAMEATLEISQASLDAMRISLPTTFDPLDELVGRVRAKAQGAVDALQVAALLEADGVNDRAARVEYGFGDVFELAEAVYQRLGGPVQRLRRSRAPVADRRRSIRDLSHGALYLLPCALFPAVLAAIQPRALVTALVLAGGLGWVWAGGTSWLAFQLLGLADRRATGRLLAFSSLVGLVVATGAGVAIASATGGGRAVMAMVPGTMAYQMASTLLLFYGHELWLATLIAPGAVAGLIYVFVDRALLSWALGSVLICVLVALGTAIARALLDGRGAPAKTPTHLRSVLSGQSGTFVLVLGYAALSAAFLLHAQAPYLLSNLDVVVVGVPLIAAMGLVEWRARRFGEQARMMLERVRYPREFVRQVWLLLLANVVACWLGVGVGAAAVLGVLGWAGWLSPAGVVMAAAQIAMAGAYFLAFILAGHNRYGWLCAAIGISIVAHLGTARLVMAMAPSPRLSAFADTSLFLGSAVLLQVLLVVALAPVVGQVRRYR